MAAIRVRSPSVTRLASTTLAVRHSACPWRVWLPHRRPWPRKRAKQSLLILKGDISLAPHLSAAVKKHKQGRKAVSTASDRNPLKRFKVRQNEGVALPSGLSAVIPAGASPPSRP